MQCPCFKCKYEEQLDSKTIKRCSTTLSLIESIPGIPMYVWKQNIVWFLVKTLNRRLQVMKFFGCSNDKNPCLSIEFPTAIFTVWNILRSSYKDCQNLEQF